MTKPKTKLILNKKDLSESKRRYLIATPDQQQFIRFLREEEMDPTRTFWYQDFAIALEDYKKLMIQGIGARIIMLEVPDEVLKDMKEEFKSQVKVARS